MPSDMLRGEYYVYLTTYEMIIAEEAFFTDISLAHHHHQEGASTEERFGQTGLLPGKNFRPLPTPRASSHEHSYRTT